MSLTALALHAAVVVFVVAAMIGFSALLGERHRGRASGEPYESGMPVTGSARGPHPVPFYLVALLFVIFDLEVAFLFAWAVAARETGPAGFVGAAIFVAILAVGLIYEWRQGVLDWGRGGGRR
jgi:NADH-quinone oxidoreductase subunit A